MKKFEEFKYWWHKNGIWVTVAVSLLGLGLLAGISASHAQEKRKYNLEKFDREIEVTCGPTLDVYEVLDKYYGEKPVAMALNDIQEAMVWFTNEKGTTMTIVMDFPNSVSCMMFSGECAEGECFIQNARVEILN